MSPDDALAFVEQLLIECGKRLNDTQREVFRGAWSGKSYKEIHKACAGCSQEHIMQNVGPDLWKLLEAVLGEAVGKKNLKGPIERAYAGQKQLDAEVGNPAIAETPTPRQLAAGPQLSFSTPFSDRDRDANAVLEFWATQPQTRQDWGTAPDTTAFYGRTRELAQLDHWIRVDGCRLIVVFGISGAGKTMLAARLAEQLKDQFELLLWRSLDAPAPLPEFLRETTGFLSERTLVSAEVADLLHLLLDHRCLIVLDGWDALLRSRVHDGSYRAGYESYSDLLRQIGRTARQSCLIVTSREKPKEIVLLESEQQRVRSFELGGLGDVGGEFFYTKGVFARSDSDWRRLTRCYAANPLLLNLVAIDIRDLFDGDVAAFLEHFQPESSLLADIEPLLTQQFERLSHLEKIVIQSCVNEPATFAEILQSVRSPISRMELQEVLQSLRRRSWLEVTAGRYTLHSLMLDYLLRQTDLKFQD